MTRFPQHTWSRRLAKALRRRMTPEEALLWVVLRDDFVHRFRRQEPLGRYIVDFVCYEARLIVEVDGVQHIDSEYDQRRDAYLESLGFRVLRFTNADVKRRLADVKGTIGSVLEARDPNRRRPPGGATSP